MGILSENINTVPGVPNFNVGEAEPNSVPFIIFACEGKEESQYLSIFHDCLPQLIDVNDYYVNDNERTSNSHPKKREEALSEFLGQNLEIKGFSEKIDKVFLIVDRDKQSFKSDQYDDIVKRCQEKGIDLIISNPSFQLWLLLHFFSDIESLKLDEESKSKKQITIIEKKLKEYISYKHGSLTVGTFSPKINDALTNAERFCLTVVELKDKIGTRFPVLIKYLMNSSR